jgi:hypothetical protein
MINNKHYTMEQMIVDQATIVNIDFTKPDVEKTLKTLQPVVFRDGARYCCHLGPDMENGILGRGDTPEAAIAAWKNELMKRMDGASEDDELAMFVRDSLSFSKNDVW